MCVYNGEKYLAQAIESILVQTFGDFELIIINDGSTDGTAGILARYERTDHRIRVYTQANQGITASRNRGCRLAKGKYIATLDADDVSLPERLASQVDYLEAHPQIGILGSWVETIDQHGVPEGQLSMPQTSGLISWHLLFGNIVAHSSVMMRRDIVERLGFYTADVPLAEDYDLWARAAAITQIAILPKVLVQYRAWEGGISKRQSEVLEKEVLRVMRSAMTRILGLDVTEEKVTSLYRFLAGQRLEKMEEIDAAANLIRHLHRAYVASSPLSRSERSEIAREVGTMLLGLTALSKDASLLNLDSIAPQPREGRSCLLSPHVVTRSLVAVFKKVFHR